ncbi:helix-turn-helix domain-containing protein [Streptomyces sp. WAC 00631]|uniref:helix-turn-helix domain-containing protein n=1 Tax=Streptomyces sp. WAC 00631 TaxID=2203201 RepID=UPI000F7AA5C2|nr:helix-turn-helix transcriptional regulator [Streptomyces sp. WAC 00631]MCC5031871.1 helix-turn-helix domain-containing protein [Streptomyces sp. WAC 00631]
MTIEGLADRLGVDPKSVERWITSDRTPHARNAHAAAKILHADAYHLWPRLDERRRSVATPRDELVTCYPTRSVVPLDLWRSLLADAVGSIDMAVANPLFLADAVWDLPGLLADKAAAGVRVRLVGPASGSPATVADVFPSLLSVPGIRLAEHGGLHADVVRADDDLIVTTPVDGMAPVLSPVMHLRRLGPAPLTSGYLTALDHLFATATPVRAPRLRAVVA